MDETLQTFNIWLYGRALQCSLLVSNNQGQSELILVSEKNAILKVSI